MVPMILYGPHLVEVMKGFVETGEHTHLVDVMQGVVEIGEHTFYK